MEAVIEAINEVSITAIVCNKTNVEHLVNNIGQMKSLKTIVYTNDCVAPDDKTVMPKPPRGVVISSFDDFVASGDTAAFPPTPPKIGTCAVIMYTSGSTGKVSVVRAPFPPLVQLEYVFILIACSFSIYLAKGSGYYAQ
jgi:long-subunit acyl-CoA synthetase (AMP-forming)